MKRLCTICARGGSKGVKNKNLRLLAGKPLIAHTVLQARWSGLFSMIAVSSDSEAILTAAKDWGCDTLIRRPAELATDTAAKLPVVQHALREAEKILGSPFETVVDLDATSPLRDVSDIARAVGLLEARKSSNVITGAPARRSPYFNLVEADENGVARLCKKPEKPIVRRQDAPKCYDMNASIYVWQRDALLKNDNLFQDDTLIFVMPEERSIDIDSEIDFELVEFLVSKRLNHG